MIVNSSIEMWNTTYDKQFPSQSPKLLKVLKDTNAELLSSSRTRSNANGLIFISSIPVLNTSIYDPRVLFHSIREIIVINIHLQKVLVLQELK